MIPAVILGIKEKPIRYYGFFVTIVFAVFATVYKPITMAYLGSYCLWGTDTCEERREASKAAGKK